MTVYDGIAMPNGKPHPLAGIPQQLFDAATDELWEAFDWDPADRPEVRSVAEAILLVAVQGLDVNRMVDDAYQDGVEAMRKVAESVIGQPLPTPQGQLF